MRKMIWGLAGTILAAAVLFGCGGKGETSPRATAAAESNREELYLYVSVLDNLEYFYDHRKGLELAQDYFGVKTEYISQQGLDVSRQVEQLEQAIARKPSGIMTFGSDDTLIPVIAKAIAAGIPFVTVDSDVVNSNRTAYVGTGNYNAGYSGGEKLAELINRRGKVAILTIPGQPNQVERTNGYKAALAKYPDIEIVQIADTHNDEVYAAQVSTEILLKYPDLAGMASLEAPGGIGIQTALRETGRAGKVKVVAMDRTTQVLEAIKENIIDATVVQQTQLMPFYAVQVMWNLKHRPMEMSSDNLKAGVTGAPYSIDTGVLIVDKSNFEYFVR